MIDKIYWEVNNPYPISVETTAHELDKYPLFIVPLIDGRSFREAAPSADRHSVTATVTINDLIYFEDEVQPYMTSGNVGNIYPVSYIGGHVVMNFLKSDDFPEIIPGRVKIELKFEFYDSQQELIVAFSPLAPLIINVKPSIIEDASATVESVGSVADLLRLYPDLVNLLNDPVPDGSVTGNKIVDGEITFMKLSQGLREDINNITYKISVYRDSNIKIVSDLNTYTNGYTVYDILLSSNILYSGQPMATRAIVMNMGNRQIAMAEDGKLYIRIYNTQSEIWSDFEAVYPFDTLDSRITALESTVGTLNTQLENALNGGV